MLSRHSKGLYIWMKSEFAKLSPDTGVESCQSSSFVQTLTVPPALFSDTFEWDPISNLQRGQSRKSSELSKHLPHVSFHCSCSVFSHFWIKHQLFPTLAGQKSESCQKSSNVQTVTAPSLFSRTFLRNPIPFLLSSIILAPINQLLLNIKYSTVILVQCLVTFANSSLRHSCLVHYTAEHH